MRTCTRCHETRDDDEFYRRTGKASRSTRCRQCHIDYARRYFRQKRNTAYETRATVCDIEHAPTWLVEGAIERLRQSALYYERQIYEIYGCEYAKHLRVKLGEVSVIFNEYLDRDEQSLHLHRRCALVRKDADKPLSRDNFQLVDYEDAREFIRQIRKTTRTAQPSLLSSADRQDA